MTALDLRPLSLAEILDRTFSFYRRFFLLFIGIAAIPHLLTVPLGLLQVLFFQTPVIVHTGGRSHPVMIPTYGTGTTVTFTLIAAIFAILVYLFSQGGTVIAVAELYLGRQTSIHASFRRVWEDFGSLFGVVVLNGLVILGGFVMLIVPGIYFMCRLLVCMPSALIEGRGPRDSLSRSWNLTRQYAGRAFVICALTFLLAITIGGVLEFPPMVAVLFSRDPATVRLWSAVSQVASALSNILVTPFMLIATAIFYFDLRVRKEAFDLQFMMDPASERVTGAGGSVPSILS